MYRLASVLALCAIFMVHGANADRDIVLLHGDPNKVTIDDFQGTIYITDGDPNTFVFECFDDATEEPANIEFIGTSGSPTGTITVSILPGNGHTYGAASIWEVDLSGANFTGQIEEIYISANLATTGDALCDNVTGDIYIGGDLGKIGLPHTKLSADTVTGAITIAGKIIADDMLEANTLGDVSIYSHPMQGTIQIYEDYAGTLFINPTMYGDIYIGDRQSQITADLTGTINIDAAHLGTIDINGSIATDGSTGRILVAGHLNAGIIAIAGSVAQTEATEPAIHVEGDITGSASTNPRIKIEGQLAGVLAVDGSLEDVVTNDVEIQVDSIDLEGLGAIAIDYDGEPLSDEWEEGAQVKVGTETYGGNTPAARVYEITNCKGDMNNNGQMDPGSGGDLEALSAAILDPSGYAEDFPGLYGSLYYTWQHELRHGRG